MQQLTLYAQRHFDFEEMLLAKRGYEHVAGHREDHQKLAAAILDMQQRLERGLAVASAEVMLFLRGSLVEHILTEDQKYAQALKNKSKPAAEETCPVPEQTSSPAEQAPAIPEEAPPHSDISAAGTEATA